MQEEEGGKKPRYILLTHAEEKQTHGGGDGGGKQQMAGALSVLVNRQHINAKSWLFMVIYGGNCRSIAR